MLAAIGARSFRTRIFPRLVQVAAGAVVVSGCFFGDSSRPVTLSQAMERCEEVALHPRARRNNQFDTVFEFSRPPCQFQLTATGVVLKGDISGSQPSPFGFAARTSRGILFTDTYTRGIVGVWDSSGHFLRTLGREGAGPGELSGWAIPFTDSRGQLYVRDEGMNWSVFDTALVFLRRIHARNHGVTPAHTIVLDDGRTITSMASWARVPGVRFILADTGGKIVKSFGKVVAKASESDFEAVSYNSGSTFWSVPLYKRNQQYTVQEWDTGGRLVRTLLRLAPWLPAPRAENRSSGAHLQPTASTVVLRVHADEHGLLLVTVRTDSLTVIDVIDPELGILLASYRDNANSNAVPRFFRRGHAGYRPAETSSGLPFLELLEYEIVADQSQTRSPR